MISDHTLLFLQLCFHCPVTWHFCSEKNTKKMEKIQESVLRFIYNDYVLNYEELLGKSKMPSLKVSIVWLKNNGMISDHTLLFLQLCFRI
jgi:hypothetical protein